MGTHLLKAAAQLGGDGVEPFVSMLDGGREGQLFADMEDFFYYAQLEMQGIDSMETREVSDKLPIVHVPRIFRALGYYPSELEVLNLTNEVKFSKYLETKEHVDEI